MFISTEDRRRVINISFIFSYFEKNFISSDFLIFRIIIYVIINNFLLKFKLNYLKYNFEKLFLKQIKKALVGLLNEGLLASYTYIEKI